MMDDVPNVPNSLVLLPNIWVILIMAAATKWKKNIEKKKNVFLLKQFNFYSQCGLFI